MGEVWRGRHQLLARPAAIKLIRSDALETDPARAAVLRERFEREAQATARLASPHTIDLYDFGISGDGTFYYVMELVSGIDLEQLVRRFGPLPPGRVVHLLKQACDSLEEAHRAGLVHRDIKPANLLVGPRGRHADFLRVLDFGLVKTETKPDAGEVKLSIENVVQGTPAYLSPEAVTGDVEVGPYSDIYALGCVAYWLLTGKPVFDEDTPMGVAVAHATRSPPPLDAHAPTASPVPDALAAVVMDCLAKDPAHRPGGAMELYRRLEACPGVSPWTPEAAFEWWQSHEPGTLQPAW
jgi:serine/threonine-protein kinase